MAPRTRLSERAISAGDLLVSTCETEVLAIHGLGSCVGVSIADPVSRVAGLAHVFLPDSRLLTDRQRRNPWNCANEAIPELLRQVLRHGGRKGRLAVVVAGGSSINAESDTAVGQQNQAACLAALLELGLRPQASYLGGPHWRTIKVFVGSGEVAVLTSNRIDLVDHPDRPGLATAALAKTNLENVDEVMDCLEPLASQTPAARNANERRPQNVQEIEQLLEHLVRDETPERPVHRTSTPVKPPATSPPPSGDLADILGPLLEAKKRLQGN